MTVLRALEAGRTADVPGGIFARAFVKSYAREVGLNPDEAVARFLEACGEARPKTRTHTVEVEPGPGEQVSLRSATVWLTVGGVSLVGLLVIFGVMSGGAPDTEVPVPPAATSPAATAPASQSAPAPATLTIAIHPTAPCWVSLTVDGDRVFSRVLQPGEREVHDASEEVVIMVGDTAAFAFSINERQGLLPDAAGQVATVTINRDNYRRYVVP